MAVNDPRKATGLMDIALEPGWLRREIDAAHESVGKWSDWKRKALREQMLEDGPRIKPVTEAG